MKGHVLFLPHTSAKELWVLVSGAGEDHKRLYRVWANELTSMGFAVALVGQKASSDMCCERCLQSAQSAGCIGSTIATLENLHDFFDSFVLLGFSEDAVIAGRVATLRPDLVSKLVVVGPVGDSEGIEPQCPTLVVPGQLEGSITTICRDVRALRAL